MADDQLYVRRVIERILTRAGYSVVGVADGRAAVEAALREPFDLAMLDAVMPELGGRAAYEQIRCRPLAGTSPRLRGARGDGKYASRAVATRNGVARQRDRG